MIPAKLKNNSTDPLSKAYQVSFTDTKYCEYTFESFQDAIVFQVGIHNKGVESNLKVISLDVN